MGPAPIGDSQQISIQRYCPNETRHSETRHNETSHNETSHSETRHSETRHSAIPEPGIFRLSRLMRAVVLADPECIELIMIGDIVFNKHGTGLHQYFDFGVIAQIGRDLLMGI